MIYPEWTKEDDSIIKNGFADNLSDRQILKLLPDRTLIAVRARRARLGLKIVQKRDTRFFYFLQNKTQFQKILSESKNWKEAQESCKLCTKSVQKLLDHHGLKFPPKRNLLKKYMHKYNPVSLTDFDIMLIQLRRKTGAPVYSGKITGNPNHKGKVLIGGVPFTIPEAKKMLENDNV